MAALLLLASLVLVSVPLAPFARAQTVVATVPVGLGSCALAYDSLRGEVFVTRGGNAVSVISDATNTVIVNVSVMKSSHSMTNSQGLAYDSSKGEVFVANPLDNAVSVISDATNTVIANVSVSGPWALAYDSLRGEVFVANDNRTVFVISDANDTVVATVKVGIAPVALTYDSLRSEVFVATDGASPNSNGTVYVISDATDKVVANVSVGLAPVALAYDSLRSEVFVANGNNDTVSVISDATDKVVATVNVGESVWGLAYDSSKGEVFVSNGGDTVSVISDATNRVVANVSVPQSPPYSDAYGVAYDSSRGEVFVGRYRQHRLCHLRRYTHQRCWDGGDLCWQLGGLLLRDLHDLRFPKRKHQQLDSESDDGYGRLGQHHGACRSGGLHSDSDRVQWHHLEPSSNLQQLHIDLRPVQQPDLLQPVMDRVVPLHIHRPEGRFGEPRRERDGGSHPERNHQLHRASRLYNWQEPWLNRRQHH